MGLKNILRAATGIQLLLLIGGIAVQEFSMKRMGMMRHILFLNQEWESRLPLEVIKTLIVALLILLFVGVSATYYGGLKEKSEKGMKLIWLTTGFITLAPILFSRLYSVENYRAYYVMGLALAIIAVIQNIKCIVIFKNK